MIDKLIGLASIGSSLATTINTTMVQRFLRGVVGVIALTILSAVMAGALLIGCFYGIYVGLTRYGLAPDAALVTIAALAVALTLALVVLTLSRLRQLQDLSRNVVPQNMPPLARAGGVVNAFFEGFKAPPSSNRN